MLRVVHDQAFDLRGPEADRKARCRAAETGVFTFTPHVYFRNFFVLSLMMTTIIACQGSDHDDDGVAVKTGALGLQCHFSEVQVSEVAYTVTHNGAATKTGIFVANSSSRDEEFSAVIGPLPAGDNYAITLAARAVRTKSKESTDCTGDGSFSVAPNQTTAVAVQLRCGGLRERGPNDNACPSIDSVRAVPSEVEVGHTLSLRGDAHDKDKTLMPLQFIWSASGGMLNDSLMRQANFVCTSAGRFAVRLKITDGDDTCPEESVTLYVKCRASTSGTSGGPSLTFCPVTNPASGGAGTNAPNGTGATGSCPSAAGSPP